MASPIVHMFPCLKDNYGFLLHDPASGETACIDTPEAAPILQQAKAKGWRITHIWNTHWHPDHTGGNVEIKAATGCTITGPDSGSFASDDIPTMATMLDPGMPLSFGVSFSPMAHAVQNDEKPTGIGFSSGDSRLLDRRGSGRASGLTRAFSGSGHEQRASP